MPVAWLRNEAGHGNFGVHVDDVRNSDIARSHYRHRFSWPKRGELWFLLRVHVGRLLRGDGDDVVASDDHQSHRSLDFAVGLSLFLGPNDSVLFGLGEDDVEVFVEGDEGADEHAAVADGDADSVVDPLPKFRLLGHLVYNLALSFL
jgi:hypothetical protein